MGGSNSEVLTDAGAKGYSLRVEIPGKLTTHSREVEEKLSLGRTLGPGTDTQ